MGRLLATQHSRHEVRRRVRKMPQALRRCRSHCAWQPGTGTAGPADDEVRLSSGRPRALHGAIPDPASHSMPPPTRVPSTGPPRAGGGTPRNRKRSSTPNKQPRVILLRPAISESCYVTCPWTPKYRLCRTWPQVRHTGFWSWPCRFGGRRLHGPSLYL